MKTHPFPSSRLLPTAGLLSILALSPQLGNAATDIPTTPTGDGLYHNELGTAYDFFDSTSASIGVSYYFAGTSDTVNQNTGYLQFALGSLPSGVEYESITLNLHITNNYYHDDSTSAGYVRHRTNSSTANGLASQRLEGDVQVAEIKDVPNGWLSIDVTSEVMNDLTAGYSHAAFSLNYNTAGYFRNSGFTITSADAGSNAPYLRFTPATGPTPEVALENYLVAADVPSDQRGAFDDPDKDGVVNLLEFALGLPPMAHSTLPVAANQSGVLSLTYTRAQQAYVNYSVKASSDLGTGDPWTESGVSQGTPDEAGVTTASIPVSESPRFLRIEASLIP
ncbi:DNRLRE domain-containing protein [Akkermansiaceae bacterium]|nr:DNRLRE domain-containing protein [Akkermansiaceae bacterium]